MSEYNAVYEQKFVNNVRRYAAMRKRIQQRCQRVLENPYHNTGCKRRPGFAGLPQHSSG